MKKLTLGLLLIAAALMLCTGEPMSQITVQPVTLPNYNGGGSSATVRIFSDQDFLTSDGVRLHKQKPGGDVWYKSLTCIVAGTNLTIPEFTIDSTTDSNNANATYTAILYDTNGNPKSYLFKKWRVPTSLGSTITYDQLVSHNSDTVPYVPGQTYTQDQVNTLVTSAVANLISEVPRTFPRSHLAANTSYPDDASLNDTDLSVTVESGGIYHFRFYLFLSSSPGGMKFKIDGTSTDVNLRAQFISYTTAGAAQAGSGQIAGRATVMTVPAGVTGYAIIEGEAEINEGGTFLLQAAQDSSNPSAATLIRGSSLILTKMT